MAAMVQEERVDGDAVVAEGTAPSAHLGYRWTLSQQEIGAAAAAAAVAVVAGRCWQRAHRAVSAAVAVVVVVVR